MLEEKWTNQPRILYIQCSWNLDCRDLGMKGGCDVFVLGVEGELGKSMSLKESQFSQLSVVSTAGLLELGTLTFTHHDKD